MPIGGRGQWGIHGDHVLLDVRLVVSHDAVDHFLFRFTFEQGHGCAEDDAAIVGNLGDIDNLGIGELAFDFLNAAFTETLLLAGGMVFGIFFQIAMFTGISNRFDNLGTQLGLEIIELLTQLFSAANSHRV